MDLKKKKYIILEIIPTSIDPLKGDVAQLSALKIDGIKLVDRFDYRLDKNKIKIPDILKMLDYDNEEFKYAKTTRAIMNNFRKFIEDLPLLIIDNAYTRNYLSIFDNKKESVFKYLGLNVSDDVFDKLMNKYGLEPSNYLVDLLYEALIKEL
ncbi:MAG: hypothetical protein IJ094_02590 [Bacilli bacterium]|nr:hypothetical protein [Bacilli bacterium]